MRLCWLTEVGVDVHVGVHAQVITTINTGKLFYCGVFHPDDDKQNVLMSGCGDKKIYQFDLNSGDVEQVCRQETPHTLGSFATAVIRHPAYWSWAAG